MTLDSGPWGRRASRREATIVSPYVVRARPGAPVAVPLHWDEVADTRLEPGRFTLRTVRRRLSELDQAGDPWAGLTKRRYSLTRAETRLDELTRARLAAWGPEDATCVRARG